MLGQGFLINFKTFYEKYSLSMWKMKDGASVQRFIR